MARPEFFTRNHNGSRAFLNHLQTGLKILLGRQGTEGSYSTEENKEAQRQEKQRVKEAEKNCKTGGKIGLRTGKSKQNRCKSSRVELSKFKQSIARIWKNERWFSTLDKPKRN